MQEGYATRWQSNDPEGEAMCIVLPSGAARDSGYSSPVAWAIWSFQPGQSVQPVHARRAEGLAQIARGERRGSGVGVQQGVEDALGGKGRTSVPP